MEQTTKRVAWVTGASRGIGRAITLKLAGAGFIVIASARSNNADAVVDKINGEGGKAVALSLDVTDSDSIPNVAKTALDQFGRIDVLVNNAGITDAIHPAEEANIDLFRSVVDVNLNSCFLLSALAAQDMLSRQEGSIINVASVHGLVASAPNLQPAYVASKAGLVNLTRELAVQWAKRGVRVNVLCPGYFETELTQVMFDDERSSGWIARNASMGRGGTPEELDGALLFLASQASSYVTGIPLPVDGGWIAR